MNSLFKTLLLTFVLITTTSISQAEVILHDTQGLTIPFSSLKGKWVFINYWASWCGTCVEEIPGLNRFYKKHQKDPVVLFGVNYDALPLFEQKFLIRKLNIQYPNLVKDPAFALGLGELKGVPVTFVFNPKGKLVKTLYGGQTSKSLDKVIKGL